MKNKVLILIFSVITILGLFVLASKVYQDQRAENLKSDSSLQKLIPDYAPRIGSSNAQIQVVEFLDPECESCREFYPYTKMLLNEFEGQVQLVLRYAPFHPNSKFVIKILEASKKQGKFWDTLETLFRYQPQWGAHHDPKPELVWKYLPEAGVDVDKIKIDMNDSSIDSLIEKEIADVNELGVRMTPTFFVNGKELVEFGYEPLKKLIQSELDLIRQRNP